MSWTRAGGTASAAVAVLLVGCAMYSQKPARIPKEPDDIVYLNDGGKLHGKIVELVPGTSLSLRDRDGVVRVVPDSQIRRVRPRSASGTAAELPPLRISDSALVGQWARFETNGLETREGRVMGIEAGTLVLRETGRWGKTRIARSEMRRALVSTSQSTRAGRQAVESAFSGAIGMGLFIYVTTGNGAWGCAAAAGGGALGAVVGALTGSLERTHRGWRRLELSPIPSAPPIVSGARVGVRARP